MEKYTMPFLVKSEDLNHHGTLFAARAASWFVEAGLLAAVKTHGNLNEIVMRNILDMSFTKPVQNGTMLEFQARVVYAGSTSLVAGIVAKNACTGEKYMEGYIAYVTVESGMGGKKPHGITLDEAADDEERGQRLQAEKLLQARKG